MKFESERRENISTQRVQESFIKIDDYARYRYYEDEDEIAHFLREEFTIDDFLDLREKKPSRLHSWENAGIVAAIETSSFEMHYPELAYKTLEFANCYRLLRSLELTGEYQRGGNTTMIGSGTVVHEVLANYLKPPPIELIRKFFLENDNLDFKIKNYLIDQYRYGSRQQYPPLRYYDGTATVIEPNLERTVKGERMLSQFKIPTNKASIHTITVGQALNEDILNVPTDNLLWYRADPDVFTTADDEKKRSEEIGELFKNVLDSAKPEKNFLLTVGTGIDDEGKRKRIELLQSGENHFESHGHGVNVESPLVFEDPYDKYLYVGQFGNIGCLLV